MVATQTSFYVTGGTLERDAPSYVQRQADEDLYAGLMAGRFCYVLTPRQMGKSSLMVRTAVSLRAASVAVVVLDLTKIGQNLTAEQWYDGLLSLVGQQLDLEYELEDFWLKHARLGPLQRWMRAMREVVLERIASRLVIFVDEIDYVRSLTFSTDEFFAGIREFYNRRAEDPALSRLTFCLLGVATPSDLIRDTRTTPFNIGTRIELTDFDEAKAAPLIQGLRRDDAKGARLLKRILYWTGGHPYLTQRLCLAVAEDADVKDAGGIDRKCEELFLSARARERDNNLLFVRERILRSEEADRASLLDLYQKIHNGKRVPDDETNLLVSVLRLSGITRAVGGLLHVRNRIYHRAFDKAWIMSNMPDAEAQRQRAAYRKGLLRSAAVAAVIIILLASLIVAAISERNRAEQERSRADESARKLQIALYVTNMNFAQQAWETGNISLLQELLEDQQPKPDEKEDLRGFEWFYFWRLCQSDITLKGHTGEVFSLDFSRDGKRIVTASADKTAKVWDAASGKEILMLEGHTESVLEAAFSLDGKRISTGSEDKTAKVWDAANGQEILKLEGHTGAINSVDFSLDGRRIVTGSTDNTAKIWDAETGKVIFTLAGHTDTVESAVFSPDGKRIVTGSSDKTAKIWNAETGQEIFTLEKDGDADVKGAFSPDGKRIVTGSSGNIAKVWDAANGQEILKLEGHTDTVLNVGFSPDGERIITGSKDKTTKIWDAKTGQEIFTLERYGRFVDFAIFTPDRKCLGLSFNDKTVEVWDAVTGREALTLKGHTNSVFNVAFSPDGERIVTSSWDNTAKVWDAKTGLVLFTLEGHRSYITGVAFSPDGKRIVTGSDDDTAKVWDAVTGRETLTLKEHTASIWDVGFSSDSERIITGSVDSTAKVWNANTGELLFTLSRQSGPLSSAVFSRDGNRIVTAGDGNTAEVWDAKTQQVLFTLKGHSNVIMSVAFSPDGKRIVTGG